MGEGTPLFKILLAIKADPIVARKTALLKTESKLLNVNI
jgi:hypothetical protein